MISIMPESGAYCFPLDDNIRFLEESTRSGYQSTLYGTFCQVMIHEQYFYPDYSAWQPDFARKVELPLALFQEIGLRSCFLEEIL